MNLTLKHHRSPAKPMTGGLRSVLAQPNAEVVRGARRNTHGALLSRKGAAVAVLVRDPSTNNAG